MWKASTKQSFQRTSSCEYRKNWYAGEWSIQALIAKSAPTAATTALHRLSFAANAVKCSAEFTGTIAAANPSFGAASSRLEPTGQECHARTVNETILENVVVQAINTLLGDKSTYQAQLQQNIAKVIRSAQQNTADGIDERLQELQKELFKKANNKEAYDEIADEIFKLREQREKCTVDTAARDTQIARINELQDFIKQQHAHLEAFDEALAKRWLERIIIRDDHFTVELKSGLKIEIEA